MRVEVRVVPWSSSTAVRLPACARSGVLLPWEPVKRSPSVAAARRFPTGWNLCAITLAVAALLAPITAARFARAAAREDIDPPSEVWTALAHDWHHGVPYRPMFSSEGYGGTRYFPGFVALQVAAMRYLPPVASGFAVGALALALLLVGSYGLLGSAGLSPLARAGGACLALMSIAVQEEAVATRADLLAVSLGLCGLWATGVVSGRRAGRLRLLLAAALFAFAWFTKWTSVAAPCLALVVLWRRGDRRASVGLLLGCAAWSLVLVGAMQIVTHGRFLEIILACATGRSSAGDVLRMPYRLLKNVGTLMPPTIPLVLLGLAAACDRAARERAPVLFGYALAALAVTAVVHLGYGVEHNHLIELEVAAALAMVTCLAAGVIHRQLAALVLAACLFFEFNLLLEPGWGLLRSRTSVTRRARYDAVLPLLRSRRGPLLSEYPLLPILAGERPFLLDPWMFGVVEARRPGPAADLRARVAREDFGAVILSGSPLTEVGRQAIDAWFGPGVGELIANHYAMAFAADAFYVLLPRRDQAAGRVQ